MIRSASEMKDNVRTAMRGGDGQVICRDFLNKGEYDGKARLFSRFRPFLQKRELYRSRRRFIRGRARLKQAPSSRMY